MSEENERYIQEVEFLKVSKEEEQTRYQVILFSSFNP